MTSDQGIIDHALRDAFELAPDDHATLAAFRQAASIQRLEAGETLVSQGDASDAMYILLRGRLLVLIDKGTGPETVGEIRRGETIGETGLVTDQPRNATVRASRASTLARIDAAEFQALLTQFPQLPLAIARTLIARSERNAKARNPGFVPQTLCLIGLSPEVDVPALAEGLAQTGVAPVSVIAEGSDPAAGRATIHDAERAGQIALIIASGANDAWRAMAVAEADEVVRICGGDGAATAAPFEVELSPAHKLALPRQTLLLLHPKGTVSPKGTARWYAQRRLTRHLHARLGDAEDMARVARILFGKAVGLVLAGGGARGAAHLGAIRALKEHGIVPDMVGGTSIGAAMAGWYAMGLRDDALDRAAKKTFVDSGPPTNDWTLLPLVSLAKGAKVKRLGREAVLDTAGSDIDIEDTWQPYFCIAANYTAQAQAVLQSGPIYRALTASYAIPGVLPPVIIDGGLHVDGGVVNNLPVDVMEDMGAAKVVAVDLLGNPHQPTALTEMPTGWAMLRDKFRPKAKRKYRVPGLISLLLNSTVLSSLERQRDMRDRANLCLRPKLTKVGLLDWDKFDQTIEQGYQSTKAQLDAIPPEQLKDLRTQPVSP